MKEPKDSHEEIEISQAPVCHVDLMPTIKKNIGLEVEEKTCSEIDEMAERERSFIRRGKGASSSVFEINVNVRDLNSWTYLYSTSDTGDSLSEGLTD